MSATTRRSLPPPLAPATHPWCIALLGKWFGMRVGRKQACDRRLPGVRGCGYFLVRSVRQLWEAGYGGSSGRLIVIVTAGAHRSVGLTDGASARGMAHRWVDIGGLRLHCLEAGAGPLVVLLHGFPEFWYAWRHQIPALADAGYRVVAPDLPGYNTSDKPPRVRDYRPRVLVQDVADLIVALGAGSAAVAGHDWGGAL